MLYSTSLFPTTTITIITTPITVCLFLIIFLPLTSCYRRCPRPCPCLPHPLPLRPRTGGGSGIRYPRAGPRSYPYPRTRPCCTGGSNSKTVSRIQVRKRDFRFLRITISCFTIVLDFTRALFGDGASPLFYPLVLKW